MDMNLGDTVHPSTSSSRSHQHFCSHAPPMQTGRAALRATPDCCASHVTGEGGGVGHVLLLPLHLSNLVPSAWVSYAKINFIKSSQGPLGACKSLPRISLHVRAMIYLITFLPVATQVTPNPLLM